jgi:hypothetical protein
MEENKLLALNRLGKWGKKTWGKKRLGGKDWGKREKIGGKDLTFHYISDTCTFFGHFWSSMLHGNTDSFLSGVQF